MTTSDYLESLQDDLERINTALELEEGTNFTDIAGMAENGDISTGGGGADLSEYFPSSISETTNYYRLIKKIPDNLIINTTNINSLFQSFASITSLPSMDTSNVERMGNMCNGCTNLSNIPLLNTSKCQWFNYCFKDCTSLISFPNWNTSSAQLFNGVFDGCTNLVNLPVLATSNVTNFQDFVLSCKSLSNDSLNNILTMCINATSYTGTKTLYQLGLRRNYYQASKIQALSNYQDFINAGWTIGYS